MQKKEKFFNFDTSASGGFSRRPCGIPAVYNSGVRAERRVDISILPGGKREVLPTSATRSPAGAAGGQREDFFQEKREQFEGENSERPVVFWRPSREKVRG